MWCGAGWFYCDYSTISFELDEVGGEAGRKWVVMQGKEREKKIKPIKQPGKALRAPTLLDKAARHE